MSKITPELRAYIETRYALSRSYATLAADLSDEVLGQKHGVSKATIYRLARRGYEFVPCRNPSKEISVETLKAIKIDLDQRKKYESLSAVDNARAISLDTGIKIGRIRAIGSYGLFKEAAPKASEKVDYVRRFLTAPVVSFGICEGYY
jgi:hypothetical protein